MHRLTLAMTPKNLVVLHNPIYVLVKTIRSTYLVKTANFVACHKQEYVHLYDMVSDLLPGGTFLLNTIWTPEELDKQLPASIKNN